MLTWFYLSSINIKFVVIVKRSKWDLSSKSLVTEHLHPFLLAVGRVLVFAYVGTSSPSPLRSYSMPYISMP